MVRVFVLKVITQGTTDTVQSYRQEERKKHFHSRLSSFSFFFSWRQILHRSKSPPARSPKNEPTTDWTIGSLLERTNGRCGTTVSFQQRFQKPQRFAFGQDQTYHEKRRRCVSFFMQRCLGLRLLQLTLVPSPSLPMFFFASYGGRYPVAQTFVWFVQRHPCCLPKRANCLF